MYKNIEEIGKILLKWVSSQIMRTSRVTHRILEKKVVSKKLANDVSKLTGIHE